MQGESLGHLKNIFGFGNREADVILLEVTTKVYRRRLAQAVNGGDLDAAPSKAAYLQKLCEELQFDPRKAGELHEGASRLTGVYLNRDKRRKPELFGLKCANFIALKVTSELWIICKYCKQRGQLTKMILLDGKTSFGIRNLSLILIGNRCPSRNIQAEAGTVSGRWFVK